MDLSSAIVLALRALGRNKMRSSLTMLGLIIGVGAVIAVIGIGEGAATKAQEQLAALGSNMLFVGSGYGVVSDTPGNVLLAFGVQ